MSTSNAFQTLFVAVHHNGTLQLLRPWLLGGNGLALHIMAGLPVSMLALDGAVVDELAALAALVGFLATRFADWGDCAEAQTGQGIGNPCMV